jgi:hypothetical protein
VALIDREYRRAQASLGQQQFPSSKGRAPLPPLDASMGAMGFMEQWFLWRISVGFLALQVAKSGRKSYGENALFMGSVSHGISFRRAL